LHGFVGVAVKDNAHIPRFEVPSFGTVPNLILTFMG